MIRCTGGLSSFCRGLCQVTSGAIEDAIQWLEQGQPTSATPLANNLIEAVRVAIATEGVCTVIFCLIYVFD